MIMFSVILFAVAGICLSQERTKLSPQKADVLEGGSVLLTCLIERNSSHSHWTWSSSYQHFIRIHYAIDDCMFDVSGFKNNSLYSVYCNVSSTSIFIRNITRSRHGELWECESDIGISNSAIVYVIVPVTSVQLESTENTISQKENSKVHLSCSTSFARPAPNITWYLKENMSGIEDHIPLLDNNILQITNNSEELFSAKSEILFHINRFFDGRRLYCSANNHPGITVVSSNILFDIESDTEERANNPADTEERANNVIAIAAGSVVGIGVLVGIIIVAIFLTRSIKHKRELPCISMIMKWKGGKKMSTIWKTSSSAAAESNEIPNSSKPQNIYEKIRRNRVEKEYQEIQFGEDDKCVYKNMQLRPPPATS